MIRCKTEPSPRVRARATPFKILLAAVMNVAYPRFKAGKDITDALVHLRNKKGARGRGEATARDPVLMTLL